MTGINNKFLETSNHFLNSRALTTVVVSSFIVASSVVLLKKVYGLVVKFFDQEEFHHKSNYAYFEKPRESYMQLNTGLDVFRFGKKIGEVRTFTTSLHTFKTIPVTTKSGNIKYVKEDDIKKIYGEHVKTLKDIRFEKPHLYKIDMREEKIVESEGEDQKVAVSENNTNPTFNKYKIENKVESKIVSLRGEEDDKSLGNIESSRGDRKVRDRQMKSVKSNPYELHQFKKKWDGNLDLKVLDMAWNFEGYHTQDLKSKWSMLRTWMRSKDSDIFVNDWNAKKRAIIADFLKDVQKDEIEFTSLFDFIDNCISAETEADKKLLDIIDESETLCVDKRLHESPFQAFGQDPKYHKRDLEGIYHTAERLGIFSIIQNLFQNNDILSCDQGEFDEKINIFYQEASEIVEKSMLEEELLKKDIKDSIVFENELDQFIVKILPVALRKITFSSADNGCGSYQITSNKNEAIKYLDEESEKFLESLSGKVVFAQSEGIEQEGLFDTTLRKEKLFEYYHAKVDQVKIFIGENFRRIISDLNQNTRSSKEAACALAGDKIAGMEAFNQNNIERILRETKGGAFIGSCRAQLYQPQKTKKKLDYFIDLVKEIRSSQSSHIS